MKILRSIHTINPALGGPIESVIQSSSALLRRGHEVEILSLDRPSDQWVRDCPVEIHALGPGRGIYGYQPRFSDWLRENRASFDAVVAHGVWQYSSFGVWRALRGGSTPYFVFPHGMLDPWFNKAYPLKHLKKSLYWPWAEYRVLRDAAAVLFTSEEEQRLARQSFRPYRCNEVVVNYGTAAPVLDLAAAREDFLKRFPHLREHGFLLFLGRLHKKKGCDLLIEAFATRGNQCLDLVVAGPCADQGYFAELKRQAERVKGVTVTGMLQGTEKWGAFSAADAFILPSHQENFGIAVVEALACGTPVLISNKVNIWREIEEEKAGYVDDDDLAGTGRLIERWLKTGPGERRLMRENAKKCFTERFEIERATDSLLNVLANC